MIVNNAFMIFFRGTKYMLKVVIVFHKRIVLLEFAHRAGGQVVAGSAGGQAVTNLVCDRSFPDPLGIVLRFDKLVFN